LRIENVILEESGFEDRNLNQKVKENSYFDLNEIVVLVLGVFFDYHS
jgi:hypothetical protein